MKKKIERKFNGTKYASTLVSETAKTIANNPQKNKKGLPTQQELLERIDEICKEMYQQLKSKKFVIVDITDHNKAFNEYFLQGGKFLVNGVKVYTKNVPCIENSGKINERNTIIYFPDTDERKLIGSGGNFVKRYNVQYRKLSNMGLI